MCKLRGGGQIVKHLLALILVAACSGGTKPSSTMPPAPETGSGLAPVAQTNSCAEEIAMRCMAPGVDGCTKGLTTSHVCVPATETAGPPCSQEMAKHCPEGQEDACLRRPPVATNHLCVLK